MEIQKNTVASRYEQLSADRQPYLERAREASKLTLPYILPPEGYGSHDKLPTPHQSVGSDGVKSLSNKIVTSLFPLNSPFFRYTPDEGAIQELQQHDPNARTAVETALAREEKIANNDIEGRRLRTLSFTLARHLIIAGNVLLYYPKDAKGVRMYSLDSYVVKRDPRGRILEVITKETVDPRTLPKEVQEKVAKGDEATNTKTSVDLYTHVALSEKGDKYEVIQEVAGEKVDKTKGDYPLDMLPWIPLRLLRIDGENYGRGFVEEHMGDLVSLEALSEALTMGAGAAAKVVFLVSPNGSTRLKDLTAADHGDCIPGHEQDVSVLQVGKHADFATVERRIQRLEDRLASSFLMIQSIQRDAERVTAEEIRRMANELDNNLGGVYSLLAEEFQLPIVKLTTKRLRADGSLQNVPEDIVQSRIITGLEALSRNHDLNQLALFKQTILEYMQVDPKIGMYINWTAMLHRDATALGLDKEGLIRGEEEVAAEQQQAQMEQMAQQVAPQVAQAAMQPPPE